MLGRKWQAALEAIVEHAAEPTLTEQARSGWAFAAECSIDQVIEPIFVVANYQGVSNAAASAWLEQNSTPDFDVLKDALHSEPCEHLSSLSELASCQYQKTEHTCAKVQNLDTCILPKLLVRRGLFAQMAAGLILWAEEHEGQKIVDWVTAALSAEDGSPRRASDRPSQELERVPGISVKVARMILADLVLAIAGDNQLLLAVAAQTVVIDRVVHNILMRTGALEHAGKRHQFGEGCYKPGGCADLIFKVSHRIDAKRIDHRWPSYAPRLVQHALWRFGAADGLRTCNANEIPNGQRCNLIGCPAKGACARLTIT